MDEPLWRDPSLPNTETLCWDDWQGTILSLPIFLVKCPGGWKPDAGGLALCQSGRRLERIPLKMIRKPKNVPCQLSWPGLSESG